MSLKVGRIIDCKVHENAEKLYVSQISLNTETVQVCSGLVGHIPLKEMINRKVILLTNLKVAKMRGEKSEAMVLATEKDEKVELINAPQGGELGQVLLFDGFEKIESPPRLKSKVWDEISSYLRTNEKGEVGYFNGVESLLRNESGEPVRSDSLVDSTVR